MTFKFSKFSPWILPFSFCVQANEIESPWYFGAGFGVGHFQNGGNHLAETSQRDSFAGTLYGGYMLSEWISLETGYQFLGAPVARYPEGEVSAQLHQVALSTVLGYSMTDWLYPYTRLGVGFWAGHTEGLNNTSMEGMSPLLGAGVALTIADNLSVRLDYQYTDHLGIADSGYSDHHLMTAGVEWRFGSGVGDGSVLSENVAEHAEEKIIEVEAKNTVVKRVRTTTEVLFAHNSAEVVNFYHLDTLVAQLNQHPSIAVLVIGHTDNSGSADYNKALSQARADAVKTRLVSRGIDATRIAIRGEGELFPLADNAEEKGRALNRRADVQLVAVEGM